MDLPQNTLACVAEILIITRRFFQHSIGEQMPQWAWSPDPLTTKLVIELGHNIRLEQIQKRPAIAVQRGSFTTRRLVFGDVGLPEYPGTSDKSIYSKEVYGTMNLNVYSREGGEAEAIANLVFELFVTQEQLLEREFKFKWLGEVTVGTLGLLEEDDTVHVVPVSVSPVVYDFAWSNKPRAAQLKRLGLTGTSEDNKVIQIAVYKEFFPNHEE